MQDLEVHVVRRAVVAFNQRFAESEARVLDSARSARAALLAGAGLEDVTAFARTVNGWGRTRASARDYPRAAAALADLDWLSIYRLERTWSEDRADFVANVCDRVVNGIRERGGRRSEYSWASKMLHWLCPEQVPVNDAFVRFRWLGIEQQGRGPYKQIAMWVFSQAARLEGQAEQIVGNVEPRTLVRAIDKAAWWLAAHQSDSDRSP